MKLVQKLAVAYLRIKLRVMTMASPRKAAMEAFELFCTPPTRDIKDLPLLFRNAEQLGFRFHEYNIIGYRWNKGGRRRVLIIHGFESTVVNFERYVEPLVGKGYEVLAFDAPAHGRSSGRQITAIVLRDFIKYINEEFGPVKSFMGHSFGGFALAIALSEMPHDDDVRAVYIAPATETKTAIDHFSRFLRLTPIVRKEFDNIILEKGGHPVSWFSIGRAMPLINAKILWLHDEDDQVTPLSDAMKVKDQNFSNIKFVITSGLGHSRIYRDAAIVAQVVDFL